MTQEQNVLAWLKSGKAITPLEALNMFGCFRLSAIIYNLREDYDINTKYITKNGKTFAEYKLIEFCA